MVKNFSGVFELYKYSEQGGGQKTTSKLKIVFEKKYTLEEEIELIKIGRKVQCRVNITPQSPEGKARKSMSGIFETLDFGIHTVRRSDNLQFILLKDYSKDDEILCASMHHDDCQIDLETIEQELNFEEKDNAEEFETEEETLLEE